MDFHEDSSYYCQTRKQFCKWWHQSGLFTLSFAVIKINLQYPLIHSENRGTNWEKPDAHDGGRDFTAEYINLERHLPPKLLRTHGTCLAYSTSDKRTPTRMHSWVVTENDKAWVHWGKGQWQSSEEARCLRQDCAFGRREALPSQPRSICPLLWRASLIRSGRRPFKSTEARQPWNPSREATSFGRLLYMPWAKPAM